MTLERNAKRRINRSKILDERLRHHSLSVRLMGDLQIVSLVGDSFVNIHVVVVVIVVFKETFTVRGRRHRPMHSAWCQPTNASSTRRQSWALRASSAPFQLCSLSLTFFRESVDPTGGSYDSSRLFEVLLVIGMDGLAVRQLTVDIPLDDVSEWLRTPYMYVCTVQRCTYSSNSTLCILENSKRNHTVDGLIGLLLLHSCYSYSATDMVVRGGVSITTSLGLRSATIRCITYSGSLTTIDLWRDFLWRTHSVQSSSYMWHRVLFLFFEARKVFFDVRLCIKTRGGQSVRRNIIIAQSTDSFGIESRRKRKEENGWDQVLDSFWSSSQKKKEESMTRYDKLMKKSICYAYLAGLPFSVVCP